jgi:hypothetical protein
MRQTRATGTLKRQQCARLKPQPLRINRNAPDSSHSYFSKTEMRQTRATAILKRQQCPRLEPQLRSQSQKWLKSVPQPLCKAIPKSPPGQLKSSQVAPSHPQLSPKSHATTSDATRNDRPKENDTHVGFSAPNNFNFSIFSII